MATGGASPEASGLLTGSETVSGALLSHVSEHIFPETRKHFALSALGLHAPQVSHIEDNFPRNSQRVNFEILESWHNNAVGMNVGIFMDRLVAWQWAGYLSKDVWSGMVRFVGPHLMPWQAIPAHPVTPIPSGDVGIKSSAPTGGESFLLQSQEHKPIDHVQKRLKSSLRRRCKHKLSTDWLPTDKAHSFELREHFVGLNHRKKVKRALGDTAEDIRTIHDILNIRVAEGGVNVALQGEAGIGKSSAMAILALDWVERRPIKTKVWNFMKLKRNKLAQFSFVFLVELGKIRHNLTLAQIIIMQHGLTDVAESQIRSILEEEHGKVLLLLDGYDEYKKGTNNDIDEAIENTVGECFLIVTSREGDYMSKETLAKIDGEIEITGFSEAGIQRCAGKYLGSTELVKDFTNKSKEVGIYGLLRVPIILLMTVVLYQESSQQLPKSLTEVVRRIVFLMIDRCTQKHFDGKRWHEIVGLGQWLKTLGLISLEAHKKGNNQILKEDVMKISPDLLKLRLLHGDFLDEASLDGRPVMMSYPHKLFLEFMAAYFAVSRVWCEFEDFPFNLLDKSMRMVATFMYGLAEDKQPVLWRFVDFISNFVEEEKTLGQSRSILENFLKEDSSEINPLYNRAICCMNDYLPRSDVLSALYIFDESQPVHWKEEVGRTSSLSLNILPCILFIRYKTDSCLYKVLHSLAENGRTIRQLRLWQIRNTITDEDEVQTMTNNDEVRTMRPFQLRFTDDMSVALHYCDMRSISLRSVLQHSPEIKHLILDNAHHVHITMFSQMKQLRCLGIWGGQYDFELCNEVGLLLTKLPTLECLGLYNEPLGHKGQPLSFDDKVETLNSLLFSNNLKRVFLHQIGIPGILAETSESSRCRPTQLEVLVLNKVQLTQIDILGLQKLIQENKMPILMELYLQGNDFTDCKHPLEKMLRTVDNKLPNCQVFVSPDELPVLDTNYACLRVQRGPKHLSTGGSQNWQINPI